MTEEFEPQGPTSSVHFREVSVLLGVSYEEVDCTSKQCPFNRSMNAGIFCLFAESNWIQTLLFLSYIRVG